MKTSTVKTLLLKYFEGLTSLEEEACLEEYFLNDRVDSEFEADKLHFQAVAAMRDEEIPVPDDLEASVMHALQKAQNVQLHSGRWIWITALSAAAGLLLMISTYLYVSRQDRTHYIDDPKIAYNESHEALELVSKYFNEGTAQLSNLSKINQAMAPLGQFNTLDKTVKSLSSLGKPQNEK